MSDLLVWPHLGLGDALVCNAIFRKLAADRPNDTVIVLCKPHNAPTLNFVFRDLKNLEFFNCENDNEAQSAMQEAKKAGYDTFGLGFFGEQPFNPKEWDKEMYRQAAVPFAQRWNGFKIDRQPSRELDYPKGRYIFVHDDSRRGYTIPAGRLPQGVEVVRADESRSGVICDNWALIENADELHFIDSCFAILSDSLPYLKAKRLVLHLYARPGALPPSYTKDWEILRS